MLQTNIALVITVQCGAEGLHAADITVQCGAEGLHAAVITVQCGAEGLHAADKHRFSLRCATGV